MKLTKTAVITFGACYFQCKLQWVASWSKLLNVAVNDDTWLLPTCKVNAKNKIASQCNQKSKPQIKMTLCIHKRWTFQ